MGADPNRVLWPVIVTEFVIDPDSVSPVWRAELLLDAAAYKLAQARAALAAAVKARKAEEPDHHFKGLPECPRVIAAYDAVREAEAAVARLERDGRA